MKIIKAIQNINPYLLFLPLLIVYIVFVVITHNNDFVGDENKYMEFAENLIKGYYSPPAPDIYLAVGPGVFLIPCTLYIFQGSTTTNIDYKCDLSLSVSGYYLQNTSGDMQFQYSISSYSILGILSKYI